MQINFLQKPCHAVSGLMEKTYPKPKYSANNTLYSGKFKLQVMNFLFLSGADGTGKTHDLKELKKELLKRNFVVIKILRTYNNDFIAILQKKDDGKYVLINSSSDNSTALEKLQVFVQNECISKGIKLDTVISSLRENTDSIRQDFWDYFVSNHNLQLNNNTVVDIPMGHPRKEPQRNNSRKFLTETTLNLILHILRLPPFQLIP